MGTQNEHHIFVEKIPKYNFFIQIFHQNFELQLQDFDFS